ncbi:hypothetical protein FN846DRAFT_786792 [Sphaerosporella brunnea]|uniref:BAH domain-containing protein n=1 Tax=Sphaerosporella brunnea TaxID=1250544 RepID=A0A5J5EG28_9PEZI|nr:hypothetical protein FN846DRAFT_786792 [Sphaerosporella brunnea]
MADRKGSASSRATNAAATGESATKAASSSSAAAITFAVRATSPYGTRSRNRGARVNYAEDKDNEMDFEFTTPYNPTSTSSKTNGDASSSGTSRRQTAAAGSGKESKDAKEPAPAMPSASSSTVTGKKRKNVASQMIIPMTKDASLSNMLSFENPFLQDGKLVADDGTTLAVHDAIYLICEPPGEPYYLGRIMDFIHANNDPARPIDMVKINWYYRPKDIQRKVNDTRIVFASMHSDVCPLSSIRGKCCVKHRSEIDNIDDYRKCRDS